MASFLAGFTRIYGSQGDDGCTSTIILHTSNVDRSTTTNNMQGLYFILYGAASWPEVKVKLPPGCLLSEPIIQVNRFSMPLEPSLGTMLAELCTISMTFTLMWLSFYILTALIICFAKYTTTKLTDIYSHSEKLLLYTID